MSNDSKILPFFDLLDALRGRYRSEFMKVRIHRDPEFYNQKEKKWCKSHAAEIKSDNGQHRVRIREVTDNRLELTVGYHADTYQVVRMMVSMVDGYIENYMSDVWIKTGELFEREKEEGRVVCPSCKRPANKKYVKKEGQCDMCDAGFKRW